MDYYLEWNGDNCKILSDESLDEVTAHKVCFLLNRMHPNKYGLVPKQTMERTKNHEKTLINHYLKLYYDYHMEGWQDGNVSKMLRP